LLFSLLTTITRRNGSFTLRLREQIRDFLKKKVYWLGFRHGNQSAQVCIADPYDASYLNVSSERLQQAAAILSAEAVLQIDSSGFYANAGTKLLQEARRLDHELAVFLGAEPSPEEQVVSLPSRMSATVESPRFDVFISHATEDKPYVEPLVKALEAAGVSVWFDRITLQWGDDLRPSIDRGLANCRFGIVVFSKAFLRKKKWTEYELNSLFALEQPGKKIILPIWHGITHDDLLQYSAGFADRLAKISSKDSYDDIVESLLGLLGRLKPQTTEAADGTDSVVTAPDQIRHVTEFTRERDSVSGQHFGGGQGRASSAQTEAARRLSSSNSPFESNLRLIPDPQRRHSNTR